MRGWVWGGVLYTRKSINLNKAIAMGNRDKRKETKGKPKKEKVPIN